MSQSSRSAADADEARWLLEADVDWWDLVRYGPPGFDVYVRIAFDADAKGDAEGEDSLRSALSTLAAHTTTPATGYAAIWAGWGSGNQPPQRRAWTSPIERCCSSRVPSTSCGTRPLWPGATGRDRNRISCGPRTEPGAWPARSTRRSSSPWDVPALRLRLWIEPCPVWFGGCPTAKQHRCTAMRPTRPTPGDRGRPPRMITSRSRHGLVLHDVREWRRYASSFRTTSVASSRSGSDETVRSASWMRRSVCAADLAPVSAAAFTMPSTPNSVPSGRRRSETPSE